MKIDCEQRGKYLLIRAEGRLDAAWADYFTDTLMLQIRKGWHLLVFDAAKTSFLSSAGIRALLQVFKELKTVSGDFRIVNPTSFVAQTLSTSGFQMWLEKGIPDDMPDTGDTGADGVAGHTGVQCYVIDEKALLTVDKPACWRPCVLTIRARGQTVQSTPATSWAMTQADGFDSFHCPSWSTQ